MEELSDLKIFLNASAGHWKRCVGPHSARYLPTPGILHWIVFTLSTLHTRNGSCITLLCLHHHHKMSISYHKNGLVSTHQTVGRWFIFVLCNKNILMKQAGDQQPTCLCVMTEFVIGTISLHVNCVHFLNLLSFMWGRHNCVRKTIFRFTCAVRWKLHG